MSVPDDADCTGPGCCGPSRREFLQVVGLGRGLAGVPGARARRHGRPLRGSDFARAGPARQEARLRDGSSRSSPAASTRLPRRDLALIGMPIGGLCAGQLYLGGDGKLWHWDIFNRVEHTNEAHYANPMRPGSPLDQGFAVRVKRRRHDRDPHARSRGILRHPLPRRVPDRLRGLSRRRLARRGVARGLLSLHPAEYRRLEPAGDHPELHGQEHLARADRRRAGRLARERRRPRYRTSGRRVPGQPRRAGDRACSPRVRARRPRRRPSPGATAGDRPGRLRGRDLRRLDRRGRGLRRAARAAAPPGRSSTCAASRARASSTPGPAATPPRAS